MTERIRIYNPEEVYNKEIIGRKILYLEHNIWIDLCAMNTVESKKLYQIILALQEHDMIIIPLSYSLISELLSQPHEADRKKRITLADQLSNGMTFRAYRSILSAELVNAFADSPLAPHIACRPFVFSYIPDHQGDYYCSPADETQAALQEAHNFALLYKDKSSYHSLLFFVDSGVANKVRINHISSQAYYLQEITADASVAVTDGLKGRLKFDSLINQERRLVFWSLVRNILRELVMSGTIKPGSVFNRKFIEYQSDLARFFKLVPTLDAACRIYAVH